MTKPTPSVADITATAIALLCRQMGPSSTARFLNQFQEGRGNYTEDRSEMLGDSTVEDLISEIKLRRAATSKR